MATIGRSSDSCTPNTSRRSYISTGEFQEDFFSYTVTTNKKKIIGTLGPVVGASCRKCPAGRILRETGRKLYPNANNGVDKYLVGVYDSISLLNGFIDPNSRLFTVYNSDRPTYIPDNGDSGDSVNSNLGPPVVTAGDIISTEGFVGTLSTLNKSVRYAGDYLYEGMPIVEAGTTCTEDCDESRCYHRCGRCPKQTYATLYADGTIESINVNDETYVRLFANGDTINTGNTSTLGSLYVDEDLHVDDDALVEGNVSTLGNLYVHGSVLVDGCVSTLGCLYVDEDLVVEDDALVEGNVSTLGNLYVQGSVLVDGCVSTLGCLYVDEDLVVDDDLIVEGDTLLEGDVSTLGRLYVHSDELVEGNLFVNQNVIVFENLVTGESIYNVKGLNLPNPQLCGNVQLAGNSTNVNAELCTPTSLIFLTYTGTLSNPGFITVYNQNISSFTIASTNSNDNSYVNYVILNNNYDGFPLFPYFDSNKTIQNSFIQK